MGEATNETRKGVKAMSNESEAESVRAVRPGFFVNAVAIIAHAVRHPRLSPSVCKYTFPENNLHSPLVMPLCGTLGLVGNRRQGLKGRSEVRRGG